MEGLARRTISSPVGPVTLVASSEGLVAVLLEGQMQGQRQNATFEALPTRDTPCLSLAAAELTEYFAGRRTTFTSPLAPQGTPFQRVVWAELRRIPFGERASYGAVAAKIGNPRAVRAVGGANARNPIAILVPCHRVIGSNDGLTGYAGGLETKAWLLAHERAVGGAGVIAGA